MPNKSTSQMTATALRTDDDRHYVVRSGVDYQITGANMPPAVYAQVTLIPAASVLTLNATPVLVVDPAPVGTVIIPLRAAIQFDNGTADYAANTTLAIGSTSVISDTVKSVTGSIADRLVPNECFAPSGIGALSPSIAEDSLSARVETGNPTTGDSDLVITVWYYLRELS